MMRVVVGDIFKSKAQTLVNTVNTVGVMGKGIALGFRTRFPDMYEDYVRRCQAGQVKLGIPYLFRRQDRPWILNFPTKEHWRSVSSLEDIIKGLGHLEEHYRDWGITSLAVPPLGCGLGQLEWRVVGQTLYRFLRRFDIDVELYAPHGTPSDQLQLAFLAGESEGEVEIPRRINPSWVALVEVLARIEHEPYHRPIGRTTFQKIAYFATELGIPTDMQFERGSFGPYASNLKRTTTALVNNGLIREELKGNMFTVKVGPTFEDARKTFQDELNSWNGIIEKVADLFMRITTSQAEVAATVHFAATSLEKQLHRRPTESEVLSEVMSWKQNRHPPLSASAVAIAIRSLNVHGWLNARSSKKLPLQEETLLGV